MSNAFLQGGRKYFTGGSAPLVTGLIETNNFSFSEVLRRELYL